MTISTGQSVEQQSVSGSAASARTGTVGSGGAAIEVSGLRHSYGERAALKGVSFNVRPAEIFGLLGPNGSGKTTLFRILSTLMIPGGGRAVVAGYDAANDPGRLRREIGV